MRSILRLWLGLAFSLCIGTQALAQAKLDQAHLDQLTAPIALYPDALLSQVLMASTYPDHVAAAAKWSAANPKLSGDAAVKAVQGEAWDPSVQSLAAFPSVLDLMGRQPAWVQSVGDAFLDQPNDVMDSVQRLRAQAQKAGSLKSTDQQKVVTQTQGATTVVQIVPANPQVVYVPAYNPTVVYGAWPYPAYPPAYYPPPPGSVFATTVVAGIGFGLGVAAVNSMWGGFNWGHGDVNINVNRYNNVNVNNHLNANQTNWQHNPANRGNVPYQGSGAQQRFEAGRQAGLQNRPAGAGTAPGAGGQGRQLNRRDQARERAAQSVEGRTGAKIPGHDVADRGGQQRLGAGGGGTQDRLAGGAGNRERPGQAGSGQDKLGGGGAGTQDKLGGAQRTASDRSDALNRSRDNNRDTALRDAGNGDRQRQQVQQAGAQRNFSQPAGGGFHGGGGAGGAFHGGGGGGTGGGFHGGGGHGRR